MTDPQLTVTAVDFERLLLHHRWIDLMFAISGFRTSDHLFPLLMASGQGNQMKFDGPNFLRLLCLMSMNTTLISRIRADWSGLFVVTSRCLLQYIAALCLLLLPPISAVLPEWIRSRLTRSQPAF